MTKLLRSDTTHFLYTFWSDQLGRRANRKPLDWRFKSTRLFQLQAGYPLAGGPSGLWKRHLPRSTLSHQGSSPQLLLYKLFQSVLQRIHRTVWPLGRGLFRYWKVLWRGSNTKCIFKMCAFSFLVSLCMSFILYILCFFGTRSLKWAFCLPFVVLYVFYFVHCICFSTICLFCCMLV